MKTKEAVETIWTAFRGENDSPEGIVDMDGFSAKQHDCEGGDVDASTEQTNGVQKLCVESDDSISAQRKVIARIYAEACDDSGYTAKELAGFAGVSVTRHHSIRTSGCSVKTLIATIQTWPNVHSVTVNVHSLKNEKLTVTLSIFRDSWQQVVTNPQ